MEIFIGFLVGAVGGTFIGMVIMASCAISSLDSREEEKQMKELDKD